MPRFFAHYGRTPYICSRIRTVIITTLKQYTHNDGRTETPTRAWHQAVGATHRHHGIPHVSTLRIPPPTRYTPPLPPAIPTLSRTTVYNTLRLLDMHGAVQTLTHRRTPHVLRCRYPPPRPLPVQAMRADIRPPGYPCRLPGGHRRPPGARSTLLLQRHLPTMSVAANTLARGQQPILTQY